MVPILYCLGNNDKKKVYTCIVWAQFFLNIFDPWLVEPMDLESEYEG
jgi:hypothetical protein